MNRAIAKWVPSAVVLAIVAYWCHPWVVGAASPQATEQAAESPKIPDSAVHLTFGTPSGRDPFRPVPIEQPTSNDATTAVHNDLEATAVPMVPTLNYTLNATYIRPDRQIAIIDSQFYSKGDRLPGPNAVNYVIADIHMDKVVLEYLGQTYDLGYSGAMAQPDRGMNIPPQSRGSLPPDRAAPVLRGPGPHRTPGRPGS